MVLGSLVCLTLLLLAMFYAARAHNLQSQLATVDTELQQLKQTPPKTNTSEVAALRQQLYAKEAAYIKLEDSYRQLLRESNGTESASVAFTSPVSTPREESAGTQTNRLSWLERMQRDDPERYKQVVAAREQRRAQMDQWYQNQLSTLDQRSQTAQTKEEQTVASQLADTLNRLSELRDAWAAVRDLPEDQRAEATAQLRAETRETYQTLNDLRERDRAIQFENLARSIGYSDSSGIQSFVTSIQQIYKNTEYNPGRGGLGGGGGGGGGGGPRGGPGQ